MTALTIGAVLPALLNSNGDAANAHVLARRAEWGGLVAPGDAVVVDLVDDWTAATAGVRPDVVVVGTAAEHELGALRDVLLREADRLRDWHAAGTRIVAIGAGWELLSESVETADGVLTGASVFPGRATRAAARVTDDLVVRHASGLLVGFENHLRGFAELPEGSALGAVASGYGNGDGTEGYAANGLFGTHLHGPVLAKNPVLADEILAGIAAERGAAYDPIRPALATVNAVAGAAREVITARLGL